jgi:tetratricopeptide (TPR) repeat protein
LQSALADFDEAILLEPNNAAAYVDRGGLNELTQNFEAALEDFHKASSFEPGLLAARTSQASVLRKLGRNFEAEEQEKLARKLIDEGDDYNQACFESRCGNFDRALNLLKIGLEKGQASKAWAICSSGDFHANVRKHLSQKHITLDKPYQFSTFTALINHDSN